jgi:hypothetical protein
MTLSKEDYWSTDDIERILANRAALLWLITHPSLRPFAPKSYSIFVSRASYAVLLGFFQAVTRLAHAPENMDQFWVNNVFQVNRQDGCELRCIRILGVVPNRQGVDLVADKVNLVLLTELHQPNQRVTRIAAS